MSFEVKAVGDFGYPKIREKEKQIGQTPGGRASRPSVWLDCRWGKKQEAFGGSINAKQLR